MTDIQLPPAGGRTTRFGGVIVSLPGDRAALTGTLDEVAQILAAIERTGRLVSATAPTPTADPGQFLINVRLVPRVQAHAVRQAAPRRKLSKRAIWAIVGGGLAFVGGLGWLVYAAITAIKANLPAVLVILGIVVAALVVVGKSAGGAGKTFSGTFQGRVD